MTADTRDIVVVGGTGSLFAPRDIFDERHDADGIRDTTDGGSAPDQPVRGSGTEETPPSVDYEVML